MENQLKISSEDFAEKCGITVDEVEKWINNPEKYAEEFAFCVSAMFSDVYSYTIEYIKNYEPMYSSPLTFDFSYPKTDEKITIIRALQEWSNLVRVDEQYKIYQKAIDLLKDNVFALLKKPKLAVLGISDAGKSSMINNFLGEQFLPQSWTPATSIIVYIKHVDDKPDFISEEMWIFKHGEGNSEWDEAKLNDKEYCLQWKLSGGSIDILSQYGTHEGEKYDEEAVGSAVVFIDHPFLKNCDIVDVPGLVGGYEHDNILAEKVPALADLIIYMSQANSFLGEAECKYISRMIKILNDKSDTWRKAELPFFVASQVDTLNENFTENIKRKLKDGSERLYSYIEKKQKYSKKEIEERFFAYSTVLRLPERIKFEDHLETYFQSYYSNIRDELNAFIDIALSPQVTIVTFEEFVEKYYAKALPNLGKIHHIEVGDMRYTEKDNQAKVVEVTNETITLECNGIKCAKPIDYIISRTKHTTFCWHCHTPMIAGINDICGYCGEFICKECDSCNKSCNYGEFGFNRNGKHRNGKKYSNSGYDFRGFNKKGIHKNGSKFADDGYDVNGYNKDGINEKGVYKNGTYFYKNKDGVNIKYKGKNILEACQNEKVFYKDPYNNHTFAGKIILCFADKKDIYVSIKVKYLGIVYTFEHADLYACIRCGVIHFFDEDLNEGILENSRIICEDYNEDGFKCMGLVGEKYTSQDIAYYHRKIVYNLKDGTQKIGVLASRYHFERGSKVDMLFSKSDRYSNVDFYDCLDKGIIEFEKRNGKFSLWKRKKKTASNQNLAIRRNAEVSKEVDEYFNNLEKYDSSTYNGSYLEKTYEMDDWEGDDYMTSPFDYE